MLNYFNGAIFYLVLLSCGALFAANEQDVIASVEYFYAQDGTLIGRAYRRGDGGKSDDWGFDLVEVEVPDRPENGDNASLSGGSQK